MNKIMWVCMALVVFFTAGCSRVKPPEESFKEQFKEQLKKFFNEEKVQLEKEKLTKQKTLEEAEQKIIGKIQEKQEAAKKEQDALKVQKEALDKNQKLFKKSQEDISKIQENQEAAKKEQDALKVQKEALDKNQKLFKKSQEDILKRLEVLEKAKENPIELIKKFQEDMKKLQDALEKVKEKPPIKVKVLKEPELKKDAPKKKTMNVFEKQSHTSLYVQKQRNAYELQLARLESELIVLDARIRFFQEAKNEFRFDRKIEKLVKENKALKESIGYWQGKYGSLFVYDADTKTLTKKEDDIKNRIASLDQQMKTLSVEDDLRAFQHRFLQLQATKRDMVDRLEQVRVETIKAQSVPMEGSVFSSATIQGFMKDVQNMKTLVVQNEEKIAKLKSEKKNGGRDIAHSTVIERLQELRQNYLFVIGNIRSSLGMPESPMAISRP